MNGEVNGEHVYFTEHSFLAVLIMCDNEVDGGGGNTVVLTMVVMMIR